MMPEAGSGQCRSDLGILTWELLRKVSSRTESDWMECPWGMTSPIRGRISAGPGACGGRRGVWGVLVWCKAS